MKDRADRIARTERIVHRRRRTLLQYGGENNTLWNRVRKHNLVCLCHVCQWNREWLNEHHRRWKLAGHSIADQLRESDSELGTRS